MGSVPHFRKNFQKVQNSRFVEAHRAVTQVDSRLEPIVIGRERTHCAEYSSQCGPALMPHTSAWWPEWTQCALRSGQSHSQPPLKGTLCHRLPSLHPLLQFPSRTWKPTVKAHTKPDIGSSLVKRAGLVTGDLAFHISAQPLTSASLWKVL